jgi:uncharacterized protein
MPFRNALALLCAGLGIALNITPVASAELDPYAVVQRVLAKHVIPEVSAFADATSPLPNKAENVCKTGDEAAREELEGQLRKAIYAYARVDFLRFGPMQRNGMREKLSFWPDPRGIMRRQLRQFLSSKGAETATTELMLKQSAALQGLPALEALVFDQTDGTLGPDPSQTKRCTVAMAVAGAIATNANTVKEQWLKEGGWKDKMLRPGSDNDTYKEPSESASELVKALLVGFQLTSDVQVKPLIAAKDEPYGPYLTSHSERQFFLENIKSIHKFYETLALESALADDQGWIVNWAGGAWRTILASDGAGGYADGARKPGAPQPREVFDKIVGLRKLVSREMAAASKLTVGFNELDGD